MPTTALDHLVVTAPSLDAGNKMVYEALGVWPQRGGEHGRMGTHNSLLRLGPKLYLEVIAVNPVAPPPERARWFELDASARHRPPVLATWVMRCDDIYAASAVFGVSHGDIESMSRGDLCWSITIPTNGGMPFDGVAPTLIQWQTLDHPATRLEDQGCTLLGLQGFHPDAARLSGLLTKISFSGEFSAAPHDSPLLIAQIQTPGGTKELRGIATDRQLGIP